MSQRVVSTVEYPIRLILSHTWNGGYSSGLQVIYEHSDGTAARVCLPYNDCLDQVRFIDDGPSVIMFDIVEEAKQRGVLKKRQVIKRWSRVREIRIRRDFQTQAK